MIARAIIACFAGIAATSAADAQSIDGTWKCQFQGGQGPYDRVIRIARGTAQFRDGKPIPITMVGNDAKFDWAAEDGRVLTITLTPAGAGLSASITGKQKGKEGGPMGGG